MRKYAAALTLLLVPGLLYAQDRERHAGRRGGPAMMGRNVIEVILEKKADLSLTDEQVARLAPIAQKLSEDNKLAREELQKLRGTSKPREMTQEQRTALRAQMDRLREQRRTAMEQATAVLTEDQQAKLRELTRPRAREGRAWRGRPGSRR